MLLFQPDVDAIKSKVEQGAEPWASAYKEVMNRADAALDQAPLSILDNGLNSRFFKQDAVYVPGKDGVKNPASNMKAMGLISKVSAACNHLAVAWQFTGEEKYADKALELIHAWTINKATYMEPTGRAPEGATPGMNPCGDVVVFLAFIPFFLACARLKDYPGWNAAPKSAVKKWVRCMLEPNLDLMFHDGYAMYNNWEDSRLLYLCYGALFLDDEKLLDYVFSRWKEIIPEKMTEAGELPRETERTRSVIYTHKSLREAIEVAETARVLGKDDLYDFTADGKNLQLAIDYFTRGLLDPESWQHPMIDPAAKEFTGNLLFELAHSFWRKPAYREVIDTYGVRNDGNALYTLLHADRFVLSD